jgi:adenosylcobinamide amidohydrolase
MCRDCGDERGCHSWAGPLPGPATAAGTDDVFVHHLEGGTVGFDAEGTLTVAGELAKKEVALVARP